MGNDEESPAVGELMNYIYDLLIDILTRKNVFSNLHVDNFSKSCKYVVL